MEHISGCVCRRKIGCDVISKRYMIVEIKLCLYMVFNDDWVLFPSPTKSTTITYGVVFSSVNEITENLLIGLSVMF